MLEHVSDLVELSVTPTPANEGTMTLSAKAGGRDAPSLADLREREWELGVTMPTCGPEAARLRRRVRDEMLRALGDAGAGDDRPSSGPERKPDAEGPASSATKSHTPLHVAAVDA